MEVVLGGPFAQAGAEWSAGWTVGERAEDGGFSPEWMKMG